MDVGTSINGLAAIEVMASEYDQDSSIIFLAMFWSGGGTMTISEIIHAYDWINRLIPTRRELEDALNYLLSANLLERDNEGFRITRKAYADFEAFLKKRRRNKFDAVKLYFKQLPLIENVVDEVQMSDEQYNEYLSIYRKAFRAALSKALKDRS